MAAALVAGLAPANGEAQAYVEATGRVADLAPTMRNVTDGAWAEVFASSAGGSSIFILYVADLDPAAEGTVYGAHVHVGPCVAGNGAAAGPHYNTGGTPTALNEVWLDFVVLPGGYGYAEAEVPFAIEPGTAQSVVIHAEPTQDGGATPGAAGGRLACLPVRF